MVFFNFFYCCYTFNYFSAFILEGSAAAFLTVPENKMTLLNSKTELQCSTKSVLPLIWSFISAGSPLFYTILYIHGNLTTSGAAKYKVDRNIRGQYNLVMESVDISYAGRYICTDGSYAPEVEAELAIIGKGYYIFLHYKVLGLSPIEFLSSNVYSTKSFYCRPTIYKHGLKHLVLNSNKLDSYLFSCLALCCLICLSFCFIPFYLFPSFTFNHIFLPSRTFSL